MNVVLLIIIAIAIKYLVEKYLARSPSKGPNRREREIEESDVSANDYEIETNGLSHNDNRVKPDVSEETVEGEIKETPVDSDSASEVQQMPAEETNEADDVQEPPAVNANELGKQELMGENVVEDTIEEQIIEEEMIEAEASETLVVNVLVSKAQQSDEDESNKEKNREQTPSKKTETLKPSDSESDWQNVELADELEMEDEGDSYVSPAQPALPTVKPRIMSSRDM